MSDKLRSTFPIAIEFSEGELPSKSKLNGIAKQARQGLSLVEYALGDVWNQSGDALLASVAAAQLMIPNLARSFGAPRHVSPRIPNLPALAEYTHDFTLVASDYETRLPFPPHSTSTYSWSDARDAVPQTNKSDVTATNQWWIDTTTGEIYAWDVFDSGVTLTYAPGYIDDGIEQVGVYGDLGLDATFNTIPDPDTNSGYAFRGLKLEYKNGVSDAEGFNIYLPPRMPLNTRRLDNSPQNDIDIPAHAGNFFDDPDGDPGHDKRFFQTDSSTAATNDAAGEAAHYRYVLPKLLTDNWSQASAVPAGLVYLWDPTGTGTIIEGLVYAAENAVTPKKWMLVVTGANLTTWLSTAQGLSAYPAANLAASSHAAAYYPNTGLRLITVGSDISLAFASLHKQFMNHDHSSQGSMVSKRINHALLDNLFENQVAPYFDPSVYPSDHHSQYMHRWGTQNASAYRDPKHGGMLGHLLMNSTNSTTNYLNVVADSNKIYWGIDSAAGPSMYYDNSIFGLHAELPDISNIGTFKISRAGNNDITFLLSATGPSNMLQSSATLSIYCTTGVSYISSESTTIQAITATQDGDGGKLYCNQIFTGGTTDATYGQSGGNYGPVRYKVLTYNDFMHSEVPGVSNAEATVTQALEYGLFSDYNVDSHRALSIKAEWHSGTDPTYLWAHIDLPYQKYCIVNVMCSATGQGTSMSLSTLYAAIGYQTWDSNPIIGTWPNGNEVEEVDVFTAMGGAGIANFHPEAVNLFTVSTTTPKVETIMSDWGGVGGPHIPWLRFRTAGAHRNPVWLTRIIVAYRVKEF